jgi:hypothetical protein
MIALPLLYLGLLNRALTFLDTKKIIVGKETHNYSCIDCMKYTSILEGIEASYLSNQNTTLELADFDYEVKTEEIARFMMSSSNRSLIFKNQRGANNKSMLFLGRKSSLRLTRIVFYEEFFSLDISNLIELKIENIHFYFMGPNIPSLSCLICLKELEYTFTLSVLFMERVYFECVSGATISLVDQREVSLIEVEGYEFIINLNDIKIFIDRIGYFKHFLKLSGIAPRPGFSPYIRFIRVKFFEFLAEKSLTLVRITLNHLNASLESCYFGNVNKFEINVLSSAFRLENCSFFLDNSYQSLITSNLAKFFIFILSSNITLENSIYRGVYLNSNENYSFLVSEQSRTFFINVKVLNIKNGEVNVNELIL